MFDEREVEKGVRWWVLREPQQPFRIVRVGDEMVPRVGDHRVLGPAVLVHAGRVGDLAGEFDGLVGDLLEDGADCAGALGDLHSLRGQQRMACQLPREGAWLRGRYARDVTAETGQVTAAKRWAWLGVFWRARLGARHLQC